MPTPAQQQGRGATDGELARAIAAGDEAAFAAFYQQWFAPALALAKWLGRRDEAWALDVVQDVMMIVVRKLPPLREDASVRAWMARTVANAVADRLRADVRRRRREQQSADGRGGVQAAEPWLQLVDDERRDWLQQNLAALSAIDRELLQARFGSSATVASAAVALGLSEDAAHGRLRRALSRLRQSAGEWWHG